MTVIELMGIVLPRVTGTPTCTLFEALRELLAIISNRLLLARSDLLREELSVNFSSTRANVTLYPEFQSMSERPYVVGKRPLNPLGRMDKSSLQTPGEPKYYDMVGKTLWLYPPPDANVTVKIPAFVRPVTLTEMDEDLPFFGDLDTVFVEGCVGLLSLGLGAVADPNFIGLLQNKIDQLLAARNIADEQTQADAINYGE
jgi:hypothetical protein